MSGCRNCGSKNWETLFYGKKVIIEGIPLIISLFKCKNCKAYSPRADVEETYDKFMGQSTL